MNAQMCESLAQKKELKRFSTMAATIVTVLTLLAFWGGLYVLRDDIFKNYYNPQRHIIIEQDPEIMEVYAWKDSNGHVYTRDDASVRYFPYRIMGLILLLMGFDSILYQLLVRFYAGHLPSRKTPSVPEKAKIKTVPAIGRQHPQTRG